MENGAEILIFVVIIYFAIVIISLIMSVTAYVFQGLGLMGIAEKTEMKQYKYFSWIPILNMYLLAYLSENTHEKGKRTAKIFFSIYGIFIVLYFILGFISAFYPESVILLLILMVTIFIPVVYLYVIYFKYLKAWYPDSTGKIVLQGILLFVTTGLNMCILFYIHRNDELYLNRQKRINNENIS